VQPASENDNGANESIHLGDFQNAILAEALLIARLNGPE
jgi:hypothetical protein